MAWTRTRTPSGWIEPLDRVHGTGRGASARLVPQMIPPGMGGGGLACARIREDKEVKMLKRPLIIACVLLSFPMLAGLVGAGQASLSRSAMNGIVGGCDACSQWISCTYCDSNWSSCDGLHLYIECLYIGEDPNLGCGECLRYESDCGYWRDCYDEECQVCDTTTDPCRGCNRLKTVPLYETCPDW
jgi:hypothetical protein